MLMLKICHGYVSSGLCRPFVFVLYIHRFVFTPLNPLIVSCILQRMGAVFPQRSENAPVFTPPQTQPLSSYPQNLRNSEPGEEIAETFVESECPTLRYTDTAQLFYEFLQRQIFANC